jgi:uncharacterized membrane protein YccC
MGSAPAVPDWARSQITDELSWLDAAMDVAGPELARNLSDLESRLTALTTWLASYGVDPHHLSSLRELTARLRACEDPDGTDGTDGTDMRSVSGLRDDARTILRKFLADLRRESHADRGRGRGGSAATPFWKRPRRAP